MQTKKEFLYTICAGAKNLDFPGKTELVDTIRAQGEIIKKLQKVTLKKTQKAEQKKKFNDTV